MNPNQKTILMLSGPSCAGKSTAYKRLAEIIPDNYLVSYDKLKWQLAGYDRNTHQQLMRRLSFGYLDVVCSEGLFVLLELWRFDESDYQKLNEITQRHGYNVVVVGMTAPDDVLVERFRERIEDAKRNGSKVSITDETVFKDRLKMPNTLPEGSLVLDSSEMNEEEVAQQIIKTLKESV